MFSYIRSEGEKLFFESSKYIFFFAGEAFLTGRNYLFYLSKSNSILTTKI